MCNRQIPCGRRLGERVNTLGSWFVKVPSKICFWSTRFMSRKWSSVVSWLLGVFIFIHFFLALMNWQFTMPDDGLDHSWVAVITHGASQGWQWGQDIVFNYGPFGFLWVRLFDEHVAAVTIGLQLLWSAGLAWGVARLLAPLPPAAALVAYGSVALGVAMSRDGSFFLPPLLVALGHFRFPTPVSTLTLIPLVVATGVGSMLKITYGMVGLMILAIVDIHRLVNQRWPVYAPLLLSVFFALYWLAGQDIAHFPTFLRLSLEIISGHSSAMALPGPWLELLAFIGLSGMALLLLVWNEWLGRRAETHPGYGPTLALFLALGLFWFINFKQGFVRHDLHSLAAWGGLAACAALAAATMWRPPTRRGFLAGLLAIAAGASVLGLWRWQLGGGPTMNTLVRVVFYGKPRHEWQNFQEWLRSPEAWVAKLKPQRDAALARIRDQHPLPPLQGSVDVIPSIQSVILAHGYDYRPRPVFQEYVAYTPQLIAANRAFLRSDHAPEYLFFSPGSIDDRYPSSAEGSAWPDILRYYRLERLVEGDLALLARRTEPLADLLSGNANRTLYFEESLALTDQTAVFARIEIEKTALGRLANLLFKPTPVFLRVKLRNGAVKTHRLIPEMAGEGFLLSPYIQSSAEFGLLATGQMAKLSDQQIEELRLETSTLGRFYYREPLHLNLQSMRGW